MESSETKWNNQIAKIVWNYVYSGHWARLLTAQITDSECIRQLNLLNNGVELVCWIDEFTHCLHCSMFLFQLLDLGYIYIIYKTLSQFSCRYFLQILFVIVHWFTTCSLTLFHKDYFSVEWNDDAQRHWVLNESNFFYCLTTTTTTTFFGRWYIRPVTQVLHSQSNQ